MKTKKLKAVPTITKGEPRFVFISADKTYVSVITMAEVVDIGTPVDPENGDDLEYLGRTTDNLEPGGYEVPA